MKNKMKTFAIRSISSLRPLISPKKKYFEKWFGLDGVSNAELKMHYQEIFLWLFHLKISKYVGFSQIFVTNFHTKTVIKSELVN